MNILQIVPNKGWGGGEKYVFDLSSTLSKARNDVLVIMPSCDTLTRKFKDLNTRTLNFRGPYDWIAICRLARLIRQHQIEIVHTHIFKHATAALLARKLFGLNVKVIMTRHLCRPAKTGLHYPWLYKSIDRIIFVSENAKDTFLSSHPHISSEKLAVIHNSVREPETSDTNLPSLRESLGLTGDRFIIGFAGTISPHKGVDFIIDLADRLHRDHPEIVFVLAGTGEASYLAAIQQKIEVLQITDFIRFIGFTDYTVDFFRQTDAVIVPTRVPESFGLAVVEAMIACRPILFSEHILPEVITPQEGIRIDTQEIDSCCRKIIELSTDTDLQARLGALGHQRWQNNFRYTLFLSRITTLYRTISQS